MSDWDSTKIVREDEKIQFNRSLAIYGSPLIQAAVTKARKEILTPANLENFLPLPADLYRAYGEYSEAFDKLIKANPSNLIIQDESPLEPNRIIRDYFYSSSTGLIRLFQCLESVEEVSIRHNNSQYSLTLEYATCPNGNPEISKIKLSPKQYPLKLKIDKLKKEIALLEADANEKTAVFYQLEFLKKQGVYRDLDCILSLQDKLDKKFGIKPKDWVSYLLNEYGISISITEWKGKVYLDFLSLLNLYHPDDNLEKFEADKTFLHNHLMEIALKETQLDEKFSRLSAENEELAYFNHAVLPTYSVSVSSRRMPSSSESVDKGLAYLKEKITHLKSDLTRMESKLSQLRLQYRAIIF